MPTARAGPSAHSLPQAVIPAFPSDAEIDATKAKLRAKLKQRRAEAAGANGAAIAQVAAARFLDALPVSSGRIVGGYWPTAEELDPLPLLRALQQKGATICLPVVTGQHGTPLGFRRWDDLTQAPPSGAYGIPAPPRDAPLLRPDILLVPLVGFDMTGRRLGMGGGYYDATLAMLRSDAAGILAVGYAFAVQQIPDVPHGGRDQHLDWIVTERAAIACGKQD